jgi:hypothetical protein
MCYSYVPTGRIAELKLNILPQKASHQAAALKDVVVGGTPAATGKSEDVMTSFLTQKEQQVPRCISAHTDDLTLPLDLLRAAVSNSQSVLVHCTWLTHPAVNSISSTNRNRVYLTLSAKQDSGLAPFFDVQCYVVDVSNTLVPEPKFKARAQRLCSEASRRIISLYNLFSEACPRTSE